MTISSSQSVSSARNLGFILTLTCLSLIKSTLYPNLVIFISETSVESVIFFHSLQPQLLQTHLSPANLTIAIHFTLASHKQISTNFNAFKIHWHVSLQTLQNINTSHQHSKNYTGLPIKQRIDYKICLLIYKTLTNQQPTYLYNSLSFPSHSVSTRSSDSLVLSIPYVRIITWQKGFLCHRSTTLEFTLSWHPKLVFSTNILFQTQNTPLQNCLPSLGSFPSPLTVYPDFDSCYSHFMPYRMTPSVRHRRYRSSLLLLLLSVLLAPCFAEFCRM